MNIEVRRKAIEMLRVILNQDIPYVEEDVVQAARELVEYMHDGEILVFGEGEHSVTVSQIPGTDSFAAYKSKFSNAAAFIVGSRDGVIRSAMNRAGLNPGMLDERYAWFHNLPEEEKASLKKAAGVSDRPQEKPHSVSLGDDASKTPKPRKRRVTRKSRGISLDG